MLYPRFSRPPSLLLFALLSPLVAGQVCQLQFDGRVPSDLVASDLDVPNDIFSETFVLGEGLTFSQALRLLPSSTASLPIAVSISDQSIFNNQVAFRRAELIPASNDGTDASTQGIKTLHFSVLKDNALPLNLSHEYQLAFLESQDFSTNQFVLKTGTILGQNTPDPDTLQLFGNVNQGDVLFSTPFTAGVFHNFALTLDFDQLTTQVFFSTGDDALVAVTDVLQNDVSGQGQFHFGVLKKPVGGVGDITKNGFQPDAIDEAVVFGGIFQEDSADGCISLSP
ncbi:hypothetical protein F5144DRAFT_588157 [Chaetomium tenue]|uniref:Uncharacterized protein n=1 Tax=Chaetomium tenue TaxID=1854479 RepID=A0ACB7PMC9_9PEZI|nr:hypothetical protein F5144DRAFT_588157 [Chaetomium globosum]